jgi:hypothetical protein
MNINILNESNKHLGALNWSLVFSQSVRGIWGPSCMTFQVNICAVSGSFLNIQFSRIRPYMPHSVTRYSSHNYSWTDQHMKRLKFKHQHLKQVCINFRNQSNKQLNKVEHLFQKSEINLIEIFSHYVKSLPNKLCRFNIFWLIDYRLSFAWGSYLAE